MELNDEVEEDFEVLKVYFDEVVLPLSKLPDEQATDGGSRTSSIADERIVGDRDRDRDNMLGYIVNSSNIDGQARNPLHSGIDYSSKNNHNNKTKNSHTLVPQEEEEVHR